MTFNTFAIPLLSQVKRPRVMFRTFFLAFFAGLCDLERRLEKAAAAAARSQYQHEVYEEAQAASKKTIDQLVEREGREDHRLEAGAYTRSRFRST